MAFFKPVLLRSCLKSEEWSNEEKRTVINFYNENPYLFQHRMKEYHDKPRRYVLLLKFEKLLKGKYSPKEIMSVCNNLKTYHDKEKLREEGSKKTGTGTTNVNSLLFLSNILH